MVTKISFWGNHSRLLKTDICLKVENQGNVGVVEGRLHTGSQGGTTEPLNMPSTTLSFQLSTFSKD